MAEPDGTHENHLEIKYSHTFSTSTLRQKKRDRPIPGVLVSEIQSSVIHSASGLIAIGQNDGRIVYWRPRIWEIYIGTGRADPFDSDTEQQHKLLYHEFASNTGTKSSIHSLCYAMCDVMDSKHQTHGVLISGSADSSIKIWDPWHRHRSAKHSAVFEIKPKHTSNQQHTACHQGTVLSLQYFNKQLLSTSTDCTLRIWSVSLAASNHAKRTPANWNPTMSTKGMRIADATKLAFQHHSSNASLFPTDQRANDSSNEYEIMYPRLQCQQVIKLGAWCRCICPSNKHLLIGDDDGVLYAFRRTFSGVALQSTAKSGQNTLSSNLSLQNENDRNSLMSVELRHEPKTVFLRNRKVNGEYTLEYAAKIHRLSIIAMLLVHKSNYVVTLSADHTLQVHDVLACSPIFAVENSEQCKYLCADYNYQHQELYVVDEHGMLQIWDIQRGQCLFTQQLRQCPIRNLHFIASSSKLVLSLTDCIEVWRMDRIRRPLHGRGHEVDVIGVAIIGPLDNKTATNRPLSSRISQEDQLQATDAVNNVSPRELENELRALDTVLYSADIDGTIRAWDMHTMSCRAILDNEKRESSLSDISAFIQVRGSRALITGHHDGKLFWWNPDNASNTKLPHAHSDAVNKIYHYQANHTELLFSIGEDGVLAVCELGTREDEKIFQWQNSFVLSKLHGMFSITADDHYCYIGGGNGEIYVYDIERSNISHSFQIASNADIIDLQIDANFLFIACDNGDIHLFELTMQFVMDTFNINTAEIRIPSSNDIPSASAGPCVGIHFHADSNLLLVVHERRIIVYDYVLGQVVERRECEEQIASFAFYNGYLFCGTKSSLVAKIRLRSFPNEAIAGIVKRATNKFAIGFSKRKSLMFSRRSIAVSEIMARRKAIEENPVVDWKKGDRAYAVHFHKSFR